MLPKQKKKKSYPLTLIKMYAVGEGPVLTFKKKKKG